MNLNVEDWQRFDRLLCVRPDNIGDVLMTTPAIRALKEARPGRHITLLTSQAGAAIARNVPEIDDVIVFDPPWYRHASAAGRQEVTRIAEVLRKRQFDGAVLFTVFSQNPLPTAMLCYLADIPRVAGYCRENPYELVTEWFPDSEPLDGVRHEVQRQLDLATALGAVPRHSALSLQVPEERSVDAVNALSAVGVDVDRPWLLLHPGASESRRRYSEQGFARTARELRDRLDVQVVVTGDAGERELAERVCVEAGAGVHSVAGKLDLDAFTVLVALAPLLISNNTGPVHIAAAVNTPVVVLYALTNPQHTPWRVPHRVLTFEVPGRATSRNTLVRYARERFFRGRQRSVSPSEIVDAAAELLDSRLSSWQRRPVEMTRVDETLRQAAAALRPG